MLEDGSAVKPNARYAEHGELDRQHRAFLAARIVERRAVDGADRAVRKGRGIEGRRVLGILVVPQAQRHGIPAHRPSPDRKSVVSGKSVSVRVDLGGSRIIKKQKNPTKQKTNN